jgi:hypothetical protein
VIVDHDQRGVGQDLDGSDGVKRIEDGGGLRLRSDQEVETGKGAVDERAGEGPGGRIDARRRGGLGVERRALIWLQPQVLARQEELHAVAQLVGQRYFREGCVDRHLQRWLVDLPQRGLDDLVVALVRIDQEGIVDDIGRDAHVLQQRLTGIARAARGEYDSRCWLGWRPASDGPTTIQ